MKNRLSGFILILILLSACLQAPVGVGQVSTPPSDISVVTPSNPPPTPSTTPTRSPTVAVTATPLATATASEVPKPKYWECGPNMFPNIHGPFDPQSEIAALPTGFIEGELKVLNNLNGVKVLACLTKINDVPDPLFPDSAIRSKVIFYDLDGGSHEYNIMTGGTENNGEKLLLAITHDIKNGTSSTLVSNEKVLPLLKEYFNNPDATTASRQIYINIVTQDLGYPWTLGEKINQNQKLIGQLVEALKTGRGFPENVPDNFFLYVTDIGFTHGFKPSYAPQ